MNNESDQFMSDAAKDEILFKPDNNNMRLFYITMIPTIMVVFAGLFRSCYLLLFVFITVPFNIWFYRQLKEQLCDVVLSPSGIKYNYFEKRLKTNILKWSEIEEIKGMLIKGKEFVMIKLHDRKRTSFVDKLENYFSYDLRISLSLFKNGVALKETIQQMYSLYKTKN